MPSSHPAHGLSQAEHVSVGVGDLDFSHVVVLDPTPPGTIRLPQRQRIKKPGSASLRWVRHRFRQQEMDHP